MLDASDKYLMPVVNGEGQDGHHPLIAEGCIQEIMGL